MGKDNKGSLDGKKIIFIGNSYTYYGNLVGRRPSTDYPTLSGRINDKENFYRLCKSKGMSINVTNWTMGAHGLQDLLGDSCGLEKECRGQNHYANLTDRYYDYVVFQSGLRNADWSAKEFIEKINEYMQDFKNANPNVKFVLLVHSQAHIYNYDWLKGVKILSAQGVIIVDWGKVVYDIMNGIAKVPNSKTTYNKNSFIVAKTENDGYHPNMLSGYITTLMTYCALTGDSAVGSEYNFVHDENSNEYLRNIDLFYDRFYLVGKSNFREILRSSTEMLGIQKIIDQYLQSKPYLNY